MAGQGLIRLIFKKKLSLAKQYSIAFQSWLVSLNKTGYPKKKNGAWMNVSELYDEFERSPKKETFLIHAKQWD